MKKLWWDHVLIIIILCSGFLKQIQGNLENEARNPEKNINPVTFSDFFITPKSLPNADIVSKTKVQNIHIDKILIPPSTNTDDTIDTRPNDKVESDSVVELDFDIGNELESQSSHVKKSNFEESRSRKSKRALKPKLRNKNELIGFFEYVRIAQERIKCILDYGKENIEPKRNLLSGNFDEIQFYPFRCPFNIPDEENQCEMCLNRTRDIKTIEDFMDIIGDIKIDELSQPDDFILSVKLNYNFTLNTPKVFCEGVSKSKLSPVESTNVEVDKNFDHFIYLKWNFINGSSSNRSDMKNKLSEPILYIIESRKKNQEMWGIVGMTEKSLARIPVEYFSQNYQFRITAVSSDGILGTSVSSNFFQTLNGYNIPSPPSNIYISAEKVNSSGTGVDIEVSWSWEHGKDQPCFYKIILDHHDNEEKTITRRVKEPRGINKEYYQNLKFGTKYTIRFIPYDGSISGSGQQVHKEFRTLSCLQALNYSFTKCVPPPPANITYKINNLNIGDAITLEENIRISLVIKWDPPYYTSILNPINYYLLEYKYGFLGLQKNNKSSDFGHFFKPIRIEGNKTSVYLDDLKPNKDFVGKLTAFSFSGPSISLPFPFSTKTYNKTEIISSLSTTWIFVPVSIICFALLFFIYKGTMCLRKRRKIKMARKQYFKNIDEKEDTNNFDWPSSPLTESDSKLQLFNENFPKEKYEILYSDLNMGDVIGQGAFGIVRKAHVSKDMLKKLPKRIEEILQNSNSSSENSSNEIPVAIKMLKVSASSDDVDQLIKEILTMHDLGFHPQIVSLLGACIRGPRLCLVLEYCPGGNLLNFLRKVREKYWPTLGLMTGQNPHQQSCSKKSVDSHGLRYASLCHSYNEESSAADDQIPRSISNLSGHFFGEFGESELSLGSFNTNTTAVNHSATSITSPKFDTNQIFDEIIADDCRPIDEKDVFSYARQICLAMEYLEKNHVVHRDIACRNILLLDDYKRVKISDFGLSRDIYTWNVYHQKTEGKLPIKWMAIESIFTHVFTTKSDVWSFGILLWELVTLGGVPYPGLSNTELFDYLRAENRMGRPENCSEELYALMEKCWRSSQSSRPNFSEIRVHLETMMESVEPSMYLSLMAEIPPDHFDLSSKSEHIIPPELSSDDESDCQSGRKQINQKFKKIYPSISQDKSNYKRKIRDVETFERNCELRAFLPKKCKNFKSDLNHVSEEDYPYPDDGKIIEKSHFDNNNCSKSESNTKSNNNNSSLKNKIIINSNGRVEWRTDSADVHV